MRFKKSICRRKLLSHKFSVPSVLFGAFAAFSKSCASPLLMTNDKKPNSLKYAAIPTLVMILIAIYPQLSLWVAQGSDWKGSYSVSNYDEVAYSAYVNALINGKARRNDPFVGREDSTGSPEPESLYSIQFFPAYAVALPARLLGLSASSAFIFLILLIAAFSSLAIFWLLREITDDDLLASTGVLVVLCLGTAIAFQGELRLLLEGRILVDFFPFLRRYQPGFAFPIFFAFCLLIWRSINAVTRRTNVAYAFLSGFAFVVLVFSYFYLWTAAIAWFGCLGLLYLIWLRKLRVNVLILSGVVVAAGVVALIPYFIMLANRSPNLDSVQLLVATRMPNFASPTLLIGLVIATATIFTAWRGMVRMSDARTLFTLSFALTPLILFNQQIVTGRSLQPVHYELFIANYLVLAALILFVSLIFQHLAAGDGEIPFRRGLVYIAVGVCVWGLIETTGSTNRNRVYAEIRDESVSAIRYIQQQRSESNDQNGTVVLATNFITADFIPSVTTARALWNPHTSSAGGIGLAENKRLFFLHVYYTGFNDSDLRTALLENSFEATAAIFGSERALPSLGSGAAAITATEIEAEGRKYAEFIRSFDADQAANPILSYAIVPSEGDTALSRISRWYDLDEEKEFGLFKVYRLKLKQPYLTE